MTTDRHFLHSIMNLTDPKWVASCLVPLCLPVYLPQSVSIHIYKRQAIVDCLPGQHTQHGDQLPYNKHCYMACRRPSHPCSLHLLPLPFPFAPYRSLLSPSFLTLHPTFRTIFLPCLNSPCLNSSLIPPRFELPTPQDLTSPLLSPLLPCNHLPSINWTLYSPRSIPPSPPITVHHPLRQPWHISLPLLFVLLPVPASRPPRPFGAS